MFTFLVGIDATDKTARSNVEYYVPECNESLKPLVGMKFVSQEAGIKFYKEYASAAGFDVRIGTTKKSADNKCVLWKYVLCNREGEKHNKSDVSYSELENGKKKKQKRVSFRCGCMARMTMKFAGAGSYVVDMFTEPHNHALISDSCKPFMKANRKMEYIHQKFVLDCARATIGPMKSFRLFKESMGSYFDIGCSSEEFKTMARAMRSFVDGVDAQMILDKLSKKKELCSAYTFDYEVDNDDKLIRLFWCDPISRQNYHMFGDIVSFDATYNTNRYCMIFAPFTGRDNHGKAVTFGAGLISKEDAESYIWLMEKFKNCMGGVPNMIVTDQDLGMKVAVERVLVGSRHRLCMWHIMLKVSDKVPSNLREDKNFKKKLGSVVWSELLEPGDFEVGWNGIMREYKLSGDKWFADMYELRRSWIPAYFRDFPFSGLIKTTSISESQNSVFGRYTRSRDNLVEFFMHYDSAIDAQRHSNGKMNYKDEMCLNKLDTHLSLEKHAAEVYTSKIFKDVKYQIIGACFYCRVLENSNQDGVKEYKMAEGSNNEFDVTYNSNDESFECSCKLFGRVGLLCSHIFVLLKDLDYKTIPEKFIVPRWTKKPFLKPIHDLVAGDGENVVILNDNKRMSAKVISEFYKCLGSVDGDNANLVNLYTDLTLLYSKYSKTDVAASSGPSKHIMLERFYGAVVPADVSILPPNVVKTKGSGSRLVSRREKAVRIANKPLRKCNKCKKMVNHDSRNCGKVVPHVDDLLSQ